MSNQLRVMRVRAQRQIRNAIGRLVTLPRPSKRVLKVGYDILAVWLALAATHALTNFNVALDNSFILLLILQAPAVVMIHFIASLYSPIAYARDIDLLRAGGLGALCGGGVMAMASLAGVTQVPVGGAVIFTAFLTPLTGGGRVWVRSFLSERKTRERERVLIYGAGEAGRQLLAALRERGRHQVVAFVDDAAWMSGQRIGGVSVFPARDIVDVLRTVHADTIMLAMPSVSASKRREILHRLEPLEQTVRTVPDINDILSGKAPLSQVRAIMPEDLLGRDPVPARRELIEPMIAGRSIMVTGAGGSIGSELCRQIIKLKPRRLVLVEQSEYALYVILQQLRAQSEELYERVSGHLGTVEDETRMYQILAEHDVEAVFHTAAYKHVPLVETNAVDAVRNNALGTARLARAAVKAGVTTFVLVSTDKAVRPANVMGASKRLAELVCKAFSQNQSGTRFAVVRFGNVLDSSGSVAPLFRDQIERGGPVTVTHNEATRYFMTLSEAAQLVIQAGALTKGGDVFVLGMGEPVRITDLACRMIRLAGYRPRFAEDGAAASREILVTFTGLRPGEKLSEELFITQAADGTEHPLILREGDEPLDPSVLNGLVARLEAACHARDATLIREILMHRFIHYRPGPAADDQKPAKADIA
ncbi:MAG: nucleoside-diphosphate sugar epimerase/dehydratase [Oceanicaulis sp.]